MLRWTSRPRPEDANPGPLRRTHFRSSRRARWLKRLARLFYPLIARLRVTGAQNIPARGPVVLVFNHLSNFDVHLLFGLLPRDDVTGLVAADYRRRPLARLMIESGGGVWLDRRRSGRAGIRRALALLDEGWLVGIAPEGGRSRTRSLGRGRPGAAYLALRANAPVVPVALTGTEKLHRGIPLLRRPVVTITFGPPLRLSPPPRASRRQRLESATEEIMTRLASMLPDRYRGVYGPDGGSSRESRRKGHVPT